MSMAYLLGIDGGGTKTEGVLTTLTGEVLAHRVTTATNPNDVGLENAADILRTLAADLMKAAGLSESDSTAVSVFCGIAGGINHRDSLEDALTARMTVGALGVRSDVHILLSGEIPAGDGACIICGTGSACFLRKGCEIIRIGGWGYLLDSGGSGYDIGRDGLEAVLRAHDGRGIPTVLTDLITDRLQGEVHTRITEIYREGKPYIAACAPLVFHAAEAGDAVANAILDRNAASLGEYVLAAIRHRGEDVQDPLVFVMGGSISQKQAPMWQERIRRAVEAMTARRGLPSPRFELTVASMPPVFGALYEAALQSGMPQGTQTADTLKRGFTASYAASLTP